jgi:SAM-dependent methyltransferase
MTHVTNEPQTWHYGLVAQWWAEFEIDGPELAYHRTFIETHGQPALDIACGTGRVLLPFLRAGLDVDGCDISPDMLALCRQKAEREGLSPRLYQQARHELDLPRTYRTIIVCGSFGLGGDRQRDMEALRRFYRHLEPGGTLVLEDYVPYGDAHEWQYWVSEKRRQLPEPWPPPGERKRAADGSEYGLRTRIVDVDPLEQRVTLQIRAEKWQAGRLVAEEERLLKSQVYFRNELMMMLQQAGFGEIRVEGDFKEEPATPDHEVLVFIAGK